MRESRAVPDLTLLSARFHSRHAETARAMAHAVIAAALAADYPRNEIDYDLVLVAMSPELLHEMRQVMSEDYTYKTEFVARIAESGQRGKAEGKAEAILRLLGNRRVRVPADIREQILACTDLEQLDRWSDQACTARGITALFPRTPTVAA